MLPSVELLGRVPLSCPSLLQLDADTPRSWIQLAKTGNWMSSRYGRFSITKDDLSQMLRNFNEVTPKSPTELPIDFDHLSMDPKKPGDGIAAGWLKKLELRSKDEELWGAVEWTLKAAEAIGNREYRFISPSFVKDHTHKDGTKIGTTLLAAAITNHPFLEGMQALTLYNFSSMGDLAVVDINGPQRTLHLADIGQRVTFAEDPELTPELTADQRAQTVIVKSCLGSGDDQVVRVITVDGEEWGWFRANQVRAADASEKQEDNPLSTEGSEVQTMSDADTSKAATRFAERVQQLGGTRDAIDCASHEDEAGAMAYRLSLLAAEQPADAPVISLSARPGESFDQVATRYAAEKNVPLRQAIHEVGRLRPDLAEAR